MTELNRTLPGRAWRRIRRTAGAVTLLSVAVSVIATNVIMEVYSAGLNLQGLIVSMAMPLVIGGPMIWFLLLKHEQLRHANNQLAHLASTDWLTGCLSRGAFTEAVTRRLEQRRGAVTGGALLIVDADDFKSVNDRFGHDAGDEALRLIARAIGRAVGDSDLVGRLGGEEFGVLLAHSGARAADHVAERIRAAVAAIDFAPGGTPCPLSVSIGGATYATSVAFGDLYRIADRHLYEAKNSGRDRVAMMQAA